MKVILLQDIKGLGKKYDVKHVADGFAANYLLPRKLIQPATPGNLARLEEAKSRTVGEHVERGARLRDLAARLGTMRLEFPVRADSQGTVFGSVTGEMIEKAMRDHGWLGPERVAVKLEHPLKALGEHRVSVDLRHEDLVAILTVVLVAKKD